jgi:PAS domain-containing protein
MLPDLISTAGNSNWWLPLAATTTACFAIVGVFSSLAYSRLRLQKLRLDTAIYNMSQGLTMFDQSGRLVLTNQRYLEMYGLSADVIKPGCTVDQVVQHRIETGSLTAHEVDRSIVLSDTAENLANNEMVQKSYLGVE